MTRHISLLIAIEGRLITAIISVLVTYGDGTGKERQGKGRSA